MPKLYAGQIDVQGEAGEGLVLLPDGGSVITDGTAGSIETEVDARECEESGTNTDTELTDNNVKEDEAGGYGNRVTDESITDESAGVVSTTVGDENVPKEKSGTVDTKTSDDQVKEEEAGITNSDILPDSALEEQQGTINKNLGLTPSCCINE